MKTVKGQGMVRRTLQMVKTYLILAPTANYTYILDTPRASKWLIPKALYPRRTPWSKTRTSPTLQQKVVTPMRALARTLIRSAGKTIY